MNEGVIFQGLIGKEIDARKNDEKEEKREKKER